MDTCLVSECTESLEERRGGDGSSRQDEMQGGTRKSRSAHCSGRNEHSTYSYGIVKRHRYLYSVCNQIFHFTEHREVVLRLGVLGVDDLRANDARSACEHCLYTIRA